MLLTISPLKRLLLGFWAVWLTLILLTNVLDALRAAEVLGSGWKLASGNYKAIGDTTMRYGVPDWLNGVMFAGVIVWESLAAGLFWRACLLHGTPRGAAARTTATTVTVALWMGFVLADEVLIAYPLVGVHLRLVVAQLVTFLVLALVPERDPT